MTESELHDTLETAITFGGKFMATLARAVHYADSVNRQRLLEAFPEIIDRYGPQTDHFAVYKSVNH